MNYLIFVKYKDKMEITEFLLSTHDFLPLVKASIQRYILLSLSEFLLSFSLLWGFYGHTLHSGFLLFPTELLLVTVLPIYVLVFHSECYYCVRDVRDFI